MTTYFISHGSPYQLCPEIVGEHDPPRCFMKSFPNTITTRPKAILAISAHWEEPVPTVGSMPTQDTIYDFRGFNSRLYKIKYDCPGSPAIARRVVELLGAAGIEGAREDPKRGLDHGSWVPLILMYPNKEVPVVQMSLVRGGDGALHYALGRALAPLRDEGVLIMGLGNATHNLRELVFGHSGPPLPWANEFDEWLVHSLVDKKVAPSSISWLEEVTRFLEVGPHARRCHPTIEHFLPLLVALGAAGAECSTQVIHRSWAGGSLSFSSFAFHPAS